MHEKLMFNSVRYQTNYYFVHTKQINLKQDIGFIAVLHATVTVWYMI